MSSPRPAHLQPVPDPCPGQPAGRPPHDRAVIETLRRRIAAIERRDARFGTGGEEGSPRPRPDAMPEIRALPRALTGITVDGPASWPAGIGFGLALASQCPGAVLWCQSGHMAREYGRLYGPGLAALGLDPARLILARTRKDADALWAMEEGLRSAGISAVVGEVAGAGFTASRRLALACAEGGTAGLLLHLPDGAATAARARWRVAPAPAAPDPWDGRAPGRPRWHVELVRGDDARTGQWTMEWDGETHRFHLAAALADRTAEARTGRAEPEVLDLRGIRTG